MDFLRGGTTKPYLKFLTLVAKKTKNKNLIIFKNIFILNTVVKGL